MWREAGGEGFNPGNYYYVGGNSEALRRAWSRCHAGRTFLGDAPPRRHLAGMAVFREELEPRGIRPAEQLYKRARSAG